MRQSLTADVDLTTATFEQAEFDRCTHHGAPIALLLRIKTTSGSWLLFDPPLVVHLRENAWIGRTLHSICSGETSVLVER